MEENRSQADSDATESSFSTTVAADKSQRKRGRKKSLEDFNARLTRQEQLFSSFESKVDKVLQFLNTGPSHTAVRPTNDGSVTLHEGTEGAPRTCYDESPGRNSPESGDAISVLVADSEKRRANFSTADFASRYQNSVGSDVSRHTIDDGENARFGKYISNKKQTIPDSNNNLVDMFGADAQASKGRTNEGLRLDESQKKVLSESLHCQNPMKLTSYRESYRTAFPLEEESSQFLQVPKLDDSVESLLVKKYGHKGAFGSSPALYNTKFKSIEKLGYQGQMAARMGIVTLCYSQKALGSLLENLQSETPNIDKAIQTTRDIFAMSTKSLDQVAKAGAFHHMSRRKAAIYDTGLDDYKDYASAVMSLPLTHEGVFGSQFDEKLKTRQERFKQISEVLPELDNSNKNSKSFAGKRKAAPTSGYSDQSKRRRTTGTYDRRGSQYTSNSASYSRGSSWYRGRNSQRGRSATLLPHSEDAQISKH